MRLFLTGLITLFGFLVIDSKTYKPQPKNDTCECDTLQTKAIITSKAFNGIPQYDTSNLLRSDFYELDEQSNRMLWYRDVENADTTKFTKLWNDYHPFNYHASHLDFINFYKGKKDIELAFQFGPNSDLWAYHIFVVKKVDCCFLITRSYFRHARFTYKAYSILNDDQLDSLFSILNKVNNQPVNSKEEYSYCGYFMDNRNKKSFFIDFKKEFQSEKNGTDEQPLKEQIQKMFDFVDNRINWTITYSL